jgi:hypothetical protein
MFPYSALLALLAVFSSLATVTEYGVPTRGRTYLPQVEGEALFIAVLIDGH